jgi:hypothetical protein
MIARRQNKATSTNHGRTFHSEHGKSLLGAHGRRFCAFTSHGIEVAPPIATSATRAILPIKAIHGLLDVI